MLWGKECAGKVQVTRQGLYYHFVCRCRLTGDVICRLHVLCGGRQESLGVVIPVDSGFGLDIKVPVKRIGEGSMEFRLIPKHEAGSGHFVPISPEEPFAYISRLKKSFLEYNNGKVGIILETGTA